MRMLIVISMMLLAILLLTRCGWNGDQKLSTNDSTQIISVQFQFVQQLIDLCAADTLRSDYASDELYNKGKADCFFKSLSVLSATQLQSFTNKNCDPNADLSTLTPDQIQNVKAACLLIGGGH